MTFWGKRLVFFLCQTFAGAESNNECIRLFQSFGVSTSAWSVFFPGVTFTSGRTHRKRKCSCCAPARSDDTRHLGDVQLECCRTRANKKHFLKDFVEDDRDRRQKTTVTNRVKQISFAQRLSANVKWRIHKEATKRIEGERISTLRHDPCNPPKFKPFYPKMKANYYSDILI